MSFYTNPVDKPTSSAGAESGLASNVDKLPNAWLDDSWDPGATGRFSESTKLVEMIPLYQTRVIRLLLYWLIIIGLIVALGTVGVPALSMFGLPIPDSIRLDKQGLAVWLGSVLLLLATWISQLIYSLRRRKPNCRTRGRIWVLAGFCWLYMSFDKIAHCGTGINAIVQSFWGETPAADGDWMGLALVYGLFLLFISARLVFEMQGTLAGQFTILAAMLCYVSAGAIWFIPEAAWKIPFPVEAVANSVVLLGDFLVFWTVLLYCRFLLLDGYGLLGAGWNEALKRYRQRKKGAKKAANPGLNCGSGQSLGSTSGSYSGAGSVRSSGYGTGVGSTSGTVSGYSSGSTLGSSTTGIGSSDYGYGAALSNAAKPVGASGASSSNKSAPAASSATGKSKFSFWGRGKAGAAGLSAGTTEQNDLLDEPIDDSQAAYDSDIDWQDSCDTADYNTGYDNNGYDNSGYDNSRYSGNVAGTGNGTNNGFGYGYGTTTTASAGRPVSGNSGGYQNYIGQNYTGQNYIGQNQANSHTNNPQPIAGNSGRSSAASSGTNGYIPQNRPNNGQSGYIPQNNPAARSQGYAAGARPAGNVSSGGYSGSGTVPAQNRPAATGSPANGTRPGGSTGTGAASQVRSQGVGGAPSGSGAAPSGTAPRRQLNPFEVQEELRKIEARWGRKLSPDERKRIIKRLLG